MAEPHEEALAPQRGSRDSILYMLRVDFLALGADFLMFLLLDLTFLDMIFAFLVKTFCVEFEKNSIWDIQITAHFQVRCTLCQNL